MKVDNEVAGDGNSYTTFFRELDTRLGRWWAVDPQATAWESTYASMGNNPIINNDILGDTIKFAPSSVGAVSAHINKMRAESILFNFIFEQLIQSTNVYTISEESIMLGGKNGMYRHHVGETEHDIWLKSDSESGTITEEFFHAFQKLSYGDERKIHEIEAEANLMQVFINGELGEELYSTDNTDDLYTNKFWGLLGESGYLINADSPQKLKDMYNSYLKDYELIKGIEGGVEAYKGKQRDLYPDAVNEVIKESPQTVRPRNRPPDSAPTVSPKQKK
jgi:hypothetical protein